MRGKCGIIQTEFVCTCCRRVLHDLPDHRSEPDRSPMVRSGFALWDSEQCAGAAFVPAGYSPGTGVSARGGNGGEKFGIIITMRGQGRPAAGGGSRAMFALLFSVMTIQTASLRSFTASISFRPRARHSEATAI